MHKPAVLLFPDIFLFLFLLAFIISLPFAGFSLLASLNIILEPD